MASPPDRAASAPGAAPAEASPGDVSALLAAAPSQPAQAWRELALRWNVAIGEGEPCVAVAQARLACFRSPNGGLALARQLGRPGWITLRSGSGSGSGPGPAGHVLLLEIDGQRATLQIGLLRQVLPLPALAALWGGDFATFWRTPPGWREAGGATDPALRSWLDGALAAAGHPAGPAGAVGPAGPALAGRIRAFQLVQGLPADGVAGPLTLMRLGRSAGVDEPRLGGAP